MVVLYILGALVAMFMAYVFLLGICALAASPRKTYNKDNGFYRFLLDSAIAVAMKLFRIHIHVTGFDKVPKDTRVLFVCNHRSGYDPLVTWYIFRRWNIAFISKPENFKIPFFGRIALKCCCMAIDRENPRNAIATINRAASLLKAQEVSIGVYPEGTRSKAGELLPFHNGVFKIAQKAEASMVVLCLRGTENIYRRIPFRATDVYLDVLEVFSSADIKANKTEIIGTQVRGLMENNLGKEINGVSVSEQEGSLSRQ